MRKMNLEMRYWVRQRKVCLVMMKVVLLYNWKGVVGRKYYILKRHWFDIKILYAYKYVRIRSTCYYCMVFCLWFLHIISTDTVCYLCVFQDKPGELFYHTAIKFIILETCDFQPFFTSFLLGYKCPKHNYKIYNLVYQNIT